MKHLMTGAVIFVVLLTALTDDKVFAVELKPLRLDNPALFPVKFEPVPAHAPVEIVKDGKLLFAIAYDMEAEKAELNPAWRSSWLAALELAEAFRRTTGEKPVIVDSKDEKALEKYEGLIFLGKCRQTEALGIRMEALPEEGFVVKTFSNGVAIVGRDGNRIKGEYKPLDKKVDNFRKCGTLWGVVDFAERFLGMRFYYPGIGVYAPSIRDLALPPAHYSDQPVFLIRRAHNFYMEFGNKGENWPWNKDIFPNDWARFFNLWRIASSSRFPGGVHTPKNWVNLYADSKPELFYRDKFGRLHAYKENVQASIIDVSNPAVVTQYMEDCRRFYESGWDEPWKGWKYPNDEYIPFGAYDNSSIIENERTKELLNPGRAGGIMSDVMARFYVRLAEAVQRELPGKKVSGFSYASYSLPPTRPLTYPPNYEHTHCGVSWGDFLSPSNRERSCAVIKAWHDLLGKPIYSYTYVVSGLPVYDITALARTKALPLYFNALLPYINGVYLDGTGGGWARSHLFHYLFRRCGWNPRIDLNAALEEYFRLMYGKGASSMQAFVRGMIDPWVEYAQNHPEANERDPRTMYTAVYPPKVINALRKHLTAARAAVEPGSIEDMRIEFIQNGWEEVFAIALTCASFSAPIYKAAFVKEGSIRVDGTLDEEIWNRCPATEMNDVVSGKPFSSRSLMRAAWSKTALYLAFDFDENQPQEMKAAAKARDEAAWADDGVEVFISPGEKKERFYQFAVNSKAVLFDAFRQLKPVPIPLAVAWNSVGVEYSANLSANRLRIEMKIPFAALEEEPPKVYISWYFNAVRNKKTKPAGTASFSMTQGNNHNVDFFGMIKFMGEGD